MYFLNCDFITEKDMKELVDNSSIVQITSAYNPLDMKFADLNHRVSCVRCGYNEVE